MAVDTMRDQAITTDYYTNEKGRIREANQNEAELNTKQVHIPQQERSVIGIFYPLVDFFRRISFGHMAHIIMTQNWWSSL